MVTPTPRARSLGHTIGVVVFGGFVGLVTLVWSVQIIQQGFWPDTPPTELGCRPGVTALLQGVRQARQSAAKQSSEESAIEAFRAEVGEIWAQFPTLRRACHSDAEALSALRDVERLRYAEEQTLRHEARDVAIWRRVLDQVERRWQGAPTPPGQPQR